MKCNAVAAILLCLSGTAHAAWDQFEIVQWQSRNSARLEALRKLGVTAVSVVANRDGTGRPLAQSTVAPHAAGLRWYIENIATDFYSPYHKYTPGKEVNWRFVETQARLQANDDGALAREPSLRDPIWRKKIRTRLTNVVTDQKSSHPLYYSLGDETGIADLTAFWDFDTSSASLAGFRTWLRSQYASLAALNEEWGTRFPTWQAIQPELTRAAMRRTDDNFATWNDFKAWMDTSFTEAVRFGTDTVHRADPSALSAIEGAQMPGWGGYDYTKLASAADVIELYDGGESLPILRALNPRVIPLITSFSAGPEEIRQIWKEVLRGVRGLILWDEDDSIVRLDATPGPRAAGYAPLFAALRGEIGRRMQHARPVYDDVALLYSPVSFRVRWMLDHRSDGDAWMRRSADIENEDNAFRVAMRDDMAMLTRKGLRPRIITPEQLANGPPRQAALFLPHVLALSDREIRSIHAFTARGGKVFADTAPGVFDEHGRRRTTPPVIVSSSELTMKPTFPIDGEADSYLYRSEGHQMLALRARTQAAMPVPVKVHLGGHSARDIVSGQSVGEDLMLDPIVPIFLEIR